MKNPGALVFMIVLLVTLGILFSEEMKTNVGDSRSSWPGRRINGPASKWADSFSVKPGSRFGQAFSDNVEEKSDHYIVTVNTLGAQMSAIDVKLKGRQLTIVLKISQTSNENDAIKGQYRYSELYNAEYSRILTLPGPVNEGKMQSQYTHGVLTITIPKA